MQGTGGWEGKKEPLSSSGLHALRDDYTGTIEPALSLAAETLTPERTLSDLVNNACALTLGRDRVAFENRPFPHAPPCAGNRISFPVIVAT